MKQHINETARHGIESFRFLVPHNTSVSAGDFAAMIRRHSGDPRAQIVADEIHKTGVTFMRNRRSEMLSVAAG
jgi:hypothetical protein